jgi:PAS domain S-box-containing protein
MADSTDAPEGEAALTQADYRAFFESAPGLYLILDRDFIIVAASDAYLSATMTTRGAIVGRNLFDVFPDDPNDPSATGAGNLRASLTRVRNLRQPDPMPVQRYSIPQPDGGGFEERYWSPLNLPILDGEGEVRWIVHRAEDVTQLISQQPSDSFQRLTNEQQTIIDRLRSINRSLDREVQRRKAAQQELSQARQFLNLVIENIPGMVYAKDAATLRFIFMNKGGEQLLGYRREEMIGKTDHDFLPKEEADAYTKRDLEVLASGELLVIPEEEITNRAGEKRFIETKKMAVFDQQGRPEFLLCLSEDISARRDLEHQLRQSQKLDAIGRLTGGMAHDFNNLLGVITANLDFLIEKSEGDEEATALAQEALDGALRGHELVKRMLAFGRQQPLQPIAFDLNEVVSGMTGLLRRTIREDIEMSVIPAARLSPVLADQSQLENAILNLAINSAHAMPNGGKLILETENISLDDEYAAQNLDVKPGDYAMLAVSDSGAGMAPEVVERAFEPFFTTKPVGAGSGLGLSQVYGFVKQSGGHIKIYSELGHGTTIRLYLPAVAQQTAAPDAGQAAPEQWRLASGNVLLVEDEENLRRAAAKMLKSLGYTVFETGSGPEALAYLRNGGQADLLFSDVVMPGGMTGVELAEIARNTWPNLNILLTSGYSEVLVRESSSRLDGIHLIGKPYRKQELAAKLRELMEGTG